MSIFVVPLKGGPGIDDELFALTKLETTSNGIRMRISGLAPDQFYRSVTDDLPIADLIGEAAERERAFLMAFHAGLTQDNPRVEEPQSTILFLDRHLQEDLATFYDLRRMTLDLLRELSEEAWQRTVTLPDGSTVTLEDLALRLQWYDAQMLRAISKQRHALLKETGVSDLRDMGVAGKLGANIAQ